LRFHDLRHQAITELSEGNASDETIMSIAGHIDRRMMIHYSHVRKSARRARHSIGCAKREVGTPHNRAHNCRSTGQVQPRNLLKRMAGTTGLEPATSAVTAKQPVVTN
jgi:hypothetical protein